MGELIERKKKILLNEPHKVHASGYDFDAIFAEPKLSGMKIYFKPYQSGSGTPSATNKRAIINHASLIVTIGNREYIVTSRGGLFSGWFDCDTYETVIEWTEQLFGASGATSYVNQGSSSVFWQYSSNLQIYNNPEVTLLSNMFTWTGYNYNYASSPDWSFAGSSAYPNSFWIKVPNSVLPELSLNGAKAWMEQNNVQVVAPRKGGAYRYISDYGLNFTKTIADRGMQHIQASDGNGLQTVEFDYWTH